MKSQRKAETVPQMFALGLLICAIVACSCAAADWPNFRGPNHNGVSDETDWLATWPESGPKIAWKASIGTGFASMAASNGRLYAMGNIDDEDILYCFNVDTGKEIWHKSYACPLYKKNHEGGPSATPTIVGDAVYTFSKNGDVLRFNAVTGDIVWHKNVVREFGAKQPTWYFASSPLVVDDLVILNAGTHGIALKTSDGSRVWQNGNDPPGYATGVPLTLGGRKCVALFVGKELVVLEAATGKVVLQFPWETNYNVNAADPIISGDTIFISSGYNHGGALLKISPQGITPVWQNRNMRNHFNSCVLWKDYIYGFDESTLKCIDHKTGEEKWAQRGLGKGSLVTAGGRLIILGERGKLVIAEAGPEQYTELASADVLTFKCWTSPILANGRIYARNAKGNLVCVDVRAGEAER